jgi:hypothetical protein
VKSLSMDTWSTDQVEVPFGAAPLVYDSLAYWWQSMRQNGNISVNKNYNPKNIKPGTPLDVDEVDSAMEKFIRQKYQERSLADGKPRPPSRDGTRDEISIPTRSPQPSPPIHVQPQKRGKIFGFKLRASSSAYPASKRDTRNLPPLEPTVDNAFRSEVHANKPSKPRVSDVSEKDKVEEEKLAALREMGFPDDKRNSAVLNRLSGDLTRTVESLVRLGEGSGNDSRRATPAGSKNNTPSQATFPDSVKTQAGHDSGVSSNPFDRPAHGNTLAVPGQQAQGQQAASYNPFDAQNTSFQPMPQAFQNMQISQPLFPHSTGGYPRQQAPVQDPRSQHSMTPPVPHVSQQYGYNTAPSTMHNPNPFLQSMEPHTTATYDGYVPTQQNAPFSAPATNPFFQQQTSYEAVQQPLQSAPFQSQTSYSNPFGIPPSPQTAPAQQQQHSTPFDNRSGLNPPTATHQSFYQQEDPQIQVQPSSENSISSLSQQASYQQSPNPYQSQFQSQTSPQYQPQPSPMLPQQTGRFDKQSILALYNYPHLAPQPMPTIPDDATPSAETPASNPLVATSQQPPNSDLFANHVPAPARRSVTMPVSTSSLSTSTAGPGSRNPFLTGSNDTSRQSSAVTSPAMTHPPPVPNSTMHRHASQESVSIANLESGRHSPDAFANLSARFVRGWGRGRWVGVWEVMKGYLGLGQGWKGCVWIHERKKETERKESWLSDGWCVYL